EEPVKDRVFTGQDVEEALASAAASLGLPRRELRYVVLDNGTSGGRGLKPTPARIAVLLHDPAAASRGASPADEPDAGRGGRREPSERGAAVATAPPTQDPREGIVAIVRAVAEAGGLALEAEIDDSGDAFVVHLKGPDAVFFHGEDARGDELFALEHLLQRSFGEALRPRMIRVRCAGFREARDAALTLEARTLADEVRESGRPLMMEPLNAYERRIVHLALQDRVDVRTYSVGEGMDRRVTIAPKDAGAPDPGEGDGR
ncbi:MAG TPA: R3H domain-containing nucleic acid-binding protein, partial [Vicinamibacteria bacterium]